MTTDENQVKSRLTPVLSDVEGNHDSRPSLISVSPRPPTIETNFDPDQYAVVRGGVKIKLPRAAYESPGADPGETLWCGEMTGNSLLLKPVKQGCHLAAHTLAGRCPTRVPVPGRVINGMTGKCRPNAGNLKFNGVLF